MLITKSKYIEELTDPAYKYSRIIETRVKPMVYENRISILESQSRFLSKDDMINHCKMSLVQGILDKDLQNDIIKIDINYNGNEYTNETVITAKCVFLNVKEYFNEVNDLKNN